MILRGACSLSEKLDASGVWKSFIDVYEEERYGNPTCCTFFYYFLWVHSAPDLGKNLDLVGNEWFWIRQTKLTPRNVIGI
jgi:hypothetical protein